MQKLKELLEKQEKIACLLAIYEKDMGNCTKIILQNGNEVLLNQSAKSTLNAIAKYYTVDMKELKKKTQRVVNSKYYVPLPINKDLLFICIKTRMPKVKKDPSISYINLHQIDRIDKKLPIIHMKNGEKIESLNSLENLMERYHKGEVCAKLKNDVQLESFKIAEDSFPYFYPATKGDIKAISKELNELKDLLKSIVATKKK